MTDFGRYSAGTKAPHKKAEPNATTFTIPLTAFLSFTRVLIVKAIVREQKVKTKVFRE